MIVNHGDTLLHEKEWETIKPPDVLMIAIGGLTIHHTIDEKEALQSVKIIYPKVDNPADDKYF